jgi:hypothetical protein
VNGDAVRRYKELADRNSQAVQSMREQNRALAEGLRKRFADADRALNDANTRSELARNAVRNHWELISEALWGERWLQIGPHPGPATPAPGNNARKADTELGRTYDALLDALRKPALLPRKQRDEH